LTTWENAETCTTSSEMIFTESWAFEFSTGIVFVKKGRVGVETSTVAGGKLDGYMNWRLLMTRSNSTTVSKNVWSCASPIELEIVEREGLIVTMLSFEILVYYVTVTVINK